MPIAERRVASVKEALAKAHGAGQALSCLFDSAGCFRFSFLVVGAMESVRLQADGHHVITLRDVQALAPPITRMGMRSFKTKKPVSMSYLHGALLIETPAELLARVGGPTVAAGRPQGQLGAPVRLRKRRINRHNCRNCGPSPTTPDRSNRMQEPDERARARGSTPKPRFFGCWERHRLARPASWRR